MIVTAPTDWRRLAEAAGIYHRSGRRRNIYSCGNSQRNQMLIHLTRVLAWLYAGALIYLTVVPSTVRPTTPLPHYVEHVVAFGLAGVLFSIAYRSRCLFVALAGIAFTVVLEALQLWVPGRHARWIDLAMDASSFCVGVSMALIVTRSASNCR
jgi:hypothetical protein